VVHERNNRLPLQEAFIVFSVG